MIEDLKYRLSLEPHPEGGHYRRIYTSDLTAAGKPALSAIHYLLEQEERSRWHAVARDEVWHFLEGDALELLLFEAEGGTLVRHRLEAGVGGHCVVPAGVWQAARPLGRYTLCACSVAPAFDFGAFTFVSDLAGHEEAFDGPLREFRDLL